MLSALYPLSPISLCVYDFNGIVRGFHPIIIIIIIIIVIIVVVINIIIIIIMF